MALTEPFDRYTERYDDWFERHEPVYRSELRALQQFVDADAFGLEIGVGSGQFADPLDVDVGIDPSREMIARARDRGIEVVLGVAERLPIADDRFDVAVLVTTICFVDDVTATLTEAARVLASDGRLVMGYIDRESPVGRIYQEMQDENPFYRDATFVSTDELLAEMEAIGYRDVDVVQTVFQSPDEMTTVDRVESGYGDGSFVALSARPPA
ncbi:MAG: class I SAM-dependent methyltransferase [Halanaeroarchaeum sp.]